MAVQLKQDEQNEPVQRNMCHVCNRRCGVEQGQYDEELDRARWLCRTCADKELADFEDVGEPDIPFDPDDEPEPESAPRQASRTQQSARPAATCMNQDDLLAHVKEKFGIEIGTFTHTFSRTGSKRQKTYEAYFEIGRVKDVVKKGEDIRCILECWVDAEDAEGQHMEHTYTHSGSHAWWEESVHALGLVPLLDDAWKKDNEGDSKYSCTDHNML
jgi:hypothetical protein